MNSQQSDQQTAIQAFKEFTGSESNEVAERVLEMCGWDLQRAINVYFTRGAQLEQEEVEIGHEIAAHPLQAVHRISHYVNRQQSLTASTNRSQTQRDGYQNDDEANANGLDDSVQMISGGSYHDDSDIQMLDNSSPSTAEHQNVRTAAIVDEVGDEIRSPIPAVQGVLLAQSYRQTYQNGDASTTTTRSSNPFLQQFHTAANRDEEENRMEEATSSSSSSMAQPQSIDFKKLQAAHRDASAKLVQKRNQQLQTQTNNEEGNAAEGIVGRENNNGQHQFRAPLQEMEIGAAAASSGGFGQGVPRRDLRILFRPPVEMNFYGDWDQALQKARQNKKWLLVNIQHSKEFASAALNRDIWSSEMVKDLVKRNFLFWQIYHESADGQRIQGYYGFHSYPTIFIVDPRTGEEVKKLEGGDVVKFLDDLTTFLQRYPSFEARDQEFRDIAARGGAAGDPKPPQSPASIPSTTVKTESSAAVACESMPSPLGGGIKRKQPSEPLIKSEGGEWVMGDEKEGTLWREDRGDEQFDDDDNVREANRQAKKMKRVVKISDIDESMQPSCSSNSMRHLPSSLSTIWTSKPQKMEEIGPKEWQKWKVPENTSQTEMPRVQLQFRLPNGGRERICLWTQAPLKALFSLIAFYGLNPHDQMLVLDFPRREFTVENVQKLDRSLGELGFGQQEMVNVEKHV